MMRTWLGLALLVGLSCGLGCGGSDDKKAEADAGSGGTSDTGGTSTSTSTGGTTTAATVTCGGVTCATPLFGEACCDTTVDPEACGMAVSAFGIPCAATPAADSRCPSAGGFVDMLAPPCCDETTNLCGLAFGGTCTDLVTLNQGAGGGALGAMMGATPDAGAGFGAGAGAGFGISIPSPVDCDGNPVEIPVQDSGTTDAGDNDAGN